MPALRVADEEDLGRIVASTRDAKKAPIQEHRMRFFMVKSGESRLSVDRLSVAPASDAVSNGERVARLRQMGMVRTTGRPSRNIRFCGWVVVSAGAARSGGCEVEATPIYGDSEESNPYHADIVLPDRVKTDDEERKKYALRLALTAVWRDHPPTPSGALSRSRPTTW